MGCPTRSIAGVILFASDSKILSELLKAPTKTLVIFLLLSLFNTSTSSYYLFACLIIHKLFRFFTTPAKPPKPPKPSLSSPLSHPPNTMPVSHIGLTVSHLPTSCSFFLAALQPLGYRFIGQQGSQIGLGISDADFFICQETPG